MDRIRDAGYEAYFVGGCVRDRLLGREPGDWDITTSALPCQVKELFSSTVDTGIKHGTVMVLYGGVGYEVTTYRIDGQYHDGRHPDSVQFTPSLEEDLKRRDFTINAFAYEPEGGIVDLFGGLNDLRDHVVRAVGDPCRRFSEDALRIMRAVRFAAQLSFEIEKNTKEAISSFAGNLSLVSAERIRVEFEKTLLSDNPAYVNKYRELGLAPYIIPNVWNKCFREDSAGVYKNIKSMYDGDAKILLLAEFFKCLTYEECSDVMKRMTYDNDTRDAVCDILRLEKRERDAAGHEKMSAAADTGGCGEKSKKDKYDDIHIREMLKYAGEDAVRGFFELAHARGTDMSYAIQRLEQILKRGDAYKVTMLDINGCDLMNAGIEKGKEIGTVLNMLLDKVIEDPALNDKEILLEMIKR